MFVYDRQSFYQCFITDCLQKYIGLFKPLIIKKWVCFASPYMQLNNKKVPYKASTVINKPNKVITSVIKDIEINSPFKEFSILLAVL